MSITHDTILARNPNQIFDRVDGEIIMLSVNNSEYYSLNEIASSIWDILNKPMSFDQLTRKLIDQFDVSEEKCKKETLSFIEELVGKGILQIKTKR